MRALAIAIVVASSSLAAAAGTPPTIVSNGSTFGVAGQPYHYAQGDKAVATGDAPITWSASTAPAGFAIDSSTGAITWTPAQSGAQSYTIVATNAAGMAMQTVTVNVAAPPAITSTPTTSATVGVAYQYGSDGAVHASGDGSISFSASQAPPGFVVDAGSGAITYTPDRAGSFPVTLVAQSAYGMATQSFTIAVAAGSGVPPKIMHDANGSAAVGVPYVYNAGRAVALSAGSTPITFAKMSGPSELYVDPRSGSVAWIPAAAGPQSITISASNLAGADQYTFTVSVAGGVTATPTAVASGTPQSGNAPLAVAFDSAGSDGGGSPILSTSWDFGDGSAPDLHAAATHTYALAGAYTARLTVTNSYGVTASATVPVSATANGVVPPTARITADQTTGKDLLNVQFMCGCSAGTHPIATVRWDFGDGSQSDMNAPMHTFLPGSYRVRLTVADSTGLSAEDSVVIAVAAGTHLPPLARAYASPPSGQAPLAVSLLATAIDLEGYVKDLKWEFGDGTTASAVDHVDKTFTDAGVYRVTLQATDDNGLTAYDSVTITVEGNDAVPPEILSVPTTVAYVGVGYSYGATTPAARGTRPLVWTLGAAPMGMIVHRDTGELRWTPTASQVGDVPVTLVVANAAAMAMQTFTIHVEPASNAPKGGCTVGETNAAPCSLVAALALILFARRRRRTTR